MESTVRINLITQQGYTPYCGSMTPRPPIGNGCDNPRTKFNGEQFVCPKCGYTTNFPKGFIDKYKQRWNL
jgi:hypothetical protein